MPALVNYSPQPHSVELREIPVPEPGETDVILEVKAVGVCGSDLHQYAGTQSWKVNHPVVLGHEFCGLVARRGPGVQQFAEGDRVVSETAAVIDAASPFTRGGRYHLDPGRLGFGYGVDGAMARFVKVPERCLHRVPEGLALEKAALVEPCCVAYHAVCVHAHIHPGDTVLVLGPGPIGLLCAAMARLSGAGYVGVVGMPSDATRLEVARRIGADSALAATGDEVVSWSRGIGDGYGFDVVVDAAGVSATLQTALAVVRPGGTITKVGWGPQPLGFSLDPLVLKAVTLQGSFSHNWPIWEKVISLLASGRLDLGPILNRVARLQEWRSVFDDMHAGRIVKGVLQP